MVWPIITGRTPGCRMVGRLLNGSQKLYASKSVVDVWSSPSLTSAIRKMTSNPVSDAGFQHVEREASSTEDFIMERSEVEAGTKLLLGTTAEIENLELTDLVAEALSRPCNIPVNFSLDRRLISGAAFAEVGYRLFAGPTFGVNARIDDKADRTHQLQIEPTVV